MVQCSSCGAMAKDGARFCPKCGSAIVSAAPSVPQDNRVYTAPEPVEPAPQPRPVPQQVTTVPQVATPPVNMADMPSASTANVLVVIGFLCGLIWGIYGFTKLKPMKEAIANGDVETAKSCFKSIRTATIIGVVLNVLMVIGRMAQAGAI